MVDSPIDPGEPPLFQRFLDHGLETGQASIPQESAVDKDRGSSSYPHPVTLGHVPFDYCPELRGFLVLVELFHIQVESLRNLSDLLRIQTVIILKEQIVEFPELALFLRRKGRDSGRSGKLVVSQGEVLEDKLHSFGVLLEHLLEHRHKPGAVGSLEIVEGGDHHRGVTRGDPDKQDSQ